MVRFSPVCWIEAFVENRRMLRSSMPSWPKLRMVRGKEAILQKIVFELRYWYGMTYLDRCGRTVNEIMREHPEWTLLSDHPNPQDAPLVSITNGCVFHFSGRKLDLALERELGKEPLEATDVEAFALQVGEVTSLVVD